jgi:hypothetical protein
MTKAQMLDKLEIGEPEWESYLSKTSKFLNEVLDQRERALHKRIYSNHMLTPLLSEATPDDISQLFETQQALLGVICSENCCG